MRYAFGDLAVDTDALQLRRGDDPVHLSPKALELLVILITERDRVVPKTELYDRLWPDTFVVEANLPVLIREIRRAIGDSKRAIVRTVHGTGYSFALAVSEQSPANAAPGNEGFVHILLYDNQQRRLAQGNNLVGREPGADVFLPSSSVSRRHALILVDGARATLTDLASKNGTFIGSQPLTENVELTDDSLIRFGEVIVRYRCCAADGATDSMTNL